MCTFATWVGCSISILGTDAQWEFYQDSSIMNTDLFQGPKFAYQWRRVVISDHCIISFSLHWPCYRTLSFLSTGHFPLIKQGAGQSIPVHSQCPAYAWRPVRSQTWEAINSLMNVNFWCILIVLVCGKWNPIVKIKESIFHQLLSVLGIICWV